MRIKEKGLQIGLIFFVLLFQIGTFGIYQDVNGQIESTVPNWIKTLAGFWSNNEITDKEFVDAIEFLIEEKIIISERIVIVEDNDINEETTTQGIVILDWVRSNAKWYSEERVSESEFLSGIEFLVEERIIQSPRIQILDEEVNQDEALPDKSLTISSVEIGLPESSGWGDQHIKLSWVYHVEHVDNEGVGFPTKGHFLIEIAGIETVTGEAVYVGENKFAGDYNGIDPGIGGGTITITVISFIGDNRGDYFGDDQEEVIIPPYVPEND